MNCSICHKEITSDSIFCDECGYPTFNLSLLRERLVAVYEGLLDDHGRKAARRFVEAAESETALISRFVAQVQHAATHTGS